MNYYKLTLLAFLSVVGNAIAQPSIPVDLVSGRSYVGVPIGEISIGSIGVPVSLNYNSSGVKLQTTEDAGGVNWGLSAGGQVTRDLRGLPDDYWGNGSDPEDDRLGWLAANALQTNSFTINADDNLTNCSDENADWNWIEDLQNRRDTEPDVFSFSAPGISGSFVFGQDLEPQFLSYQDLKVEFEPSDLSGPITKIYITRNDGIKYTFSQTETTIRQSKHLYQQPVTQFVTEFELFRKSTKYASEWGLKEIKAPSGESIVLDYVRDSESPWSSNNYRDFSYPSKTVQLLTTSTSATDSPNDHYEINDIVSKNYLYRIKSPQKSMYFKWVDYRAQILSEVKIKPKNGVEKTFGFNYVQAVNQNEDRGKYFLRDVIEKNSDCENFPAFSFEYYDIGTENTGIVNTSMTFETTDMNQDLWGYYNATAVSMNPTIYFYDTKTGGDRYRFYEIAGLNETAKIDGADRSVNANTVHYGSLKKITYPTGGSATLAYEPNDYYDQENDVTQFGNGLRLQSITYEEPIAFAENTVISYDYSASNGKSSGQWIYRSVFGYHDVDNFYATTTDQSTEPYILYENVKVSKTGKGYSEYEYLLPGNYPLTSHASRTEIARNGVSPCTQLGELKKQYYLHPFGPNTNLDYERGLLDKVTDYTSGGLKVSEKEYSYQSIGNTSSIVKGMRYEKLNNTSDLSAEATGANLYVYNHYSLKTNTGKVVLIQTDRAYDMQDQTKVLESSTTYTYSSIHHMLNETAMTNSDGVAYKERFKYAKDFDHLTQPNPSNQNALMIKRLNDDYMHGTLIEKINFIDAGTETVNGASITLFEEYLNSSSEAHVYPSEVLVFNGTTGYTPTSVAPSSGANQVLSYAGYRTTGHIDSYNDIGLPSTVQSNKKTKSGTIYGYANSTPLARINNATSEAVLYDGFESLSDGGFDTKPRNPEEGNLWSGKFGIVLNSTEELVKEDLVNESNDYTFSTRVHSNAVATVTYELWDNTTLIKSGTLTYSLDDIGTWKYLKDNISMSGVPAIFDIKVKTSASVDLDEVLFYPKEASVSTVTYEPLFGKTSETDSKGRSVFYEYDGLGRLKFIRDQDKNLKQVNDYYYSVQPIEVLSAEYTASHKDYQVVKDVTVDYTAAGYLNCGLSTVEYDWYVDGVKLGNNTETFSYTFDQAKAYEVKLITTHPVLGTSEKATPYDVKDIGSGPIGAKVSSDSGVEYDNCGGEIKTFTAELLGCFVEEDVRVNWYYQIDHSGNWIEIFAVPTNKLQIVFNAINELGGTSNLADYDVKVEVNTVCPVTGEYSIKETSKAISYTDNQPCQ